MAGSIKTSSQIRAEGNATPAGAAGAGIELQGGATSYLQAYNRTSAAYSPLVIDGSTIGIGTSNNAPVTIPGTLLQTGEARLVAGARIGADSTNNLLDDASTGAGTATLYIGNASINVTSDENLKYNIQPFKSGLELVKQLQPIEFDQDEMRPFGHIRHYVGFGARAVHKVAPWAVHTQGNTGLPWQARYEFLMAPVVGAVQELDSRLAAIEAKLH